MSRECSMPSRVEKFMYNFDQNNLRRQFVRHKSTDRYDNIQLGFKKLGLLHGMNSRGSGLKLVTDSCK
jgi:hypothetical protein